MPDLSVSRHIAAPTEEVWSIITDLEGSVETISGITSIERLDGGADFGVGTRWRETRKMFGKEATEEMEVTSLEVQRSYTTVADGHSVHYMSTMSVEAAGDGTLLSMTFDAAPQGGFAKFMAATVGRLMKGATRKMIARDLEDIAKAVEG